MEEFGQQGSSWECGSWEAPTKLSPKEEIDTLSEAPFE